MTLRSLERARRRADRPPISGPRRRPPRLAPTCHAPFGCEVRVDARPRLLSELARQARPPETIQSQAEHDGCGTFFVTVALGAPGTNRTRSTRARGLSALGGFQHRAGWEDTGGRIPPERDQELAREGDDADTARAFPPAKALLIPARQRALALPMHPAPRELHHHRLEPLIPGPANALIACTTRRCRISPARIPAAPQFAADSETRATPRLRRATRTRSSSRRL